MATVRMPLYCPHQPTYKQLLFLSLKTEEGFYGGAAGGGKSDALLMAALQYVDTPGYAALLLRRTFKALTLPEALLDRSRMWLSGHATWYAEPSCFRFPSGASITFGYLEHDKDVEQYQSAAFQFIGFDELTQFTEYQYRYMHSRTRRLVGSDIPIRIRGASNPGSIGHEWVKQRFLIEGRDYSRPFIPALLDDNPHVDRPAYVKSLNNLDPITRARLLKGDWSARQAGGKFRREWFEIVDVAPADCFKLRFWDMAATEPKPGKDPDWTVGCLMGLSPNGTIYIIDIRRFRGTPQANEQLVRQTAEIDGRQVPVRMEQEPGSSGVKAIDDYRRRVLMGWDFKGIPSTGSKDVRSNPLSSQSEAGNVKLVRGLWITEFLDELEAFPSGGHDDQVDAASGAFDQLTLADPEPQEQIVVYDSIQHYGQIMLDPEQLLR
ncbi:MAG: phage terminase large subunit [Gammaproteobacteria bacterium]|nr:phage terminase large subunit [Gammaproteobacteria bacterium]